VRAFLSDAARERNRRALTIPRAGNLTAEEFRRLARARLPAELPADALSPASRPRASDFRLSGAEPDAALLEQARPAAVLTPIVSRDVGLSVLLTLRATQLRSHSGQVAFPGGKIDPGETAGETALREAREEIGLEASFVEPIGWLDSYLTGTGFRVAPLVALVRPGFQLTINSAEVAEAFETPLAFLMAPENHQLLEREWRGQRRKFYAMPHEGRYIWGATAGILRNLYERLFT
jgi:8-oxo-dGTP pyrophosphatase MutT (NUDIX family)